MTATELIAVLQTLSPNVTVTKIREGFPCDFHGTVEVIEAIRVGDHYWKHYRCFDDEGEVLKIAIIR